METPPLSPVIHQRSTSWDAQACKVVSKQTDPIAALNPAERPWTLEDLESISLDQVSLPQYLPHPPLPNVQNELLSNRPWMAQALQQGDYQRVVDTLKRVVEHPAPHEPTTASEKMLWTLIQRADGWQEAIASGLPVEEIKSEYASVLTYQLACEPLISAGILLEEEYRFYLSGPHTNDADIFISPEDSAKLEDKFHPRLAQIYLRAASAYKAWLKDHYESELPTALEIAEEAITHGLSLRAVLWNHLLPTLDHKISATSSMCL